MKTPKDIGRIFQQAREAKNLTVEEAYHRSHIHTKVIQDIENGVFDRIGKIYIKSFLKKYSEFLGLDTESILKDFAALSNKIPEKEFNPDVTPQKSSEEKDETIPALTEEKIKTILVAVFSVALIILFFVLVGMIRSKVSSHKEALPKKRVLSTQVIIEPMGDKSKPKVNDNFAKSDLTLTLTASEDVWVQVTDGDHKIFSNVIKKGESVVLGSSGTLTVWTGNTAVVDFNVNGQGIGPVAQGVVKNIKVSTKGVQIGDEWVALLK